MPLAGLAVWAVIVPEGMAYAGIVGVPPIMGLYTIVPPLIAYALLGTSRLLVVGPDTATGLISALTVGGIALQGTADFNALTPTVAILIGGFFLLLGALHMGWVAAFIPTPVMRGFIEGLVCVTIMGQVPHLLGIEGTSGNFFTKLWSALLHLPDARLPPILTGVLSLIAMLLLHGLVPRIPAALVVAMAGTLGVGLLGGVAASVSVVGEIPAGLPHLMLPNLDPAILIELAPGALAIVLVGYAEALAGAKAATMQGSGDVDPNQELIAHGPANILSGLFGGFLVVGSLSKTSVAMAAGARTQLANLVAAVFCFFFAVIDTAVQRHAAPGSCSDRDRGDAPSLQTPVSARPTGPHPLGVCSCRDRHRGGADAGRAAWDRSWRSVIAADVDLPDRSPGRRGARSAARY
ncbi:MAG: SulP family inorganic anion transporter [Acetobacteraceae bacterium]|nr:SulP family inorganic anion transporter [Acetobacteraceae bacterium]